MTITQQKKSTSSFAGITFIDLFCGVGGVRLGLEQHSILDDIAQKHPLPISPQNTLVTSGSVNYTMKCVFSCDVDVECQKTYTTNFGDVPTGDITIINENSIPNHDILCGGFPCQPFSISGKQFGFNDTRGTLFFDIARIIDVKRPKVLLLENVKNLLYHDGGKTLQVIISVLEKFGYRISYQVMNAKDFGIPQFRERIIIIGIYNGDKAFAFEKVEKMSATSMYDFFESVHGIYDDYDRDYTFLDDDAYTLLCTPTYNKNSGLIFAGYRNKAQRKTGVKPNSEHLSRSHRQCNRIYSIYGTHPTLSAQEKSGRYFILDEKKRVRKLTIDECWDLMGFPLSYIHDSSLSVQYHQLGNSVCVPMIEKISQAILEQAF